ncbi:MAG: hypothetical protein WAX77_09115 [Methylococcaceae bacterium]
MSNSDPLIIKCETHGKRIAALVCCHLLLPSDSMLGFVENNSYPNDLQAWCDNCEQLFLKEQEMTKAFIGFSNAKIICNVCYNYIKESHAKSNVES